MRNLNTTDRKMPKGTAIVFYLLKFLKFVPSANILRIQLPFEIHQELSSSLEIILQKSELFTLITLSHCFLISVDGIRIHGLTFYHGPCLFQ